MHWNDERAAPLARGLTTADRDRLDWLLARAEEGESPPPESGGRWLNVRPDPIDFRDRTYEPGLQPLRARLAPDGALLDDIAVRDQGDSKACTGMALALAIDFLRMRRGRADDADPQLRPEPVSARMLYEMAQAFDEFPDDGLRGSSMRGALRGFFHNGVCEAQPRDDDFMPPPWLLTAERARNARGVSLGVYLRLRHVLLDYHAALNEIGVLVVTARIHEGWHQVADGKIPWSGTEKGLGLHAFALVGYDDHGFLVCNSWGREWGGWTDSGERRWPGIARWSYDDWQRNAVDAWAIRLAVSPPRFFNAIGGFHASTARPETAFSQTPPRIAINGHYLHVKDGRLVQSGVFNSSMESVHETRDLLASHTDYRHLVFVIDSGLESRDTMVQRAAVLTPYMKAVKAYPMFVFWREDAFEVTSELLEDRYERLAARTGGFESLRDMLLERFAKEFLPPVWRTFEGEVERAFTTHDPTRGRAWRAVRELLAGARSRQDPLSAHFVAHGAGAIWLVALLQRIGRAKDLWTTEGNTQSLRRKAIATIDLLAPVCTKQALEEALKVTWGAKPQAHKRGAPEPLAVYTLSAEDEAADRVGAFRGSFLELARRVFPIDGQVEAEVAGHETVARALAPEGRRDRAQFVVTDKPIGAKCRTHRGMANDVGVLATVLTRITQCGPGVTPSPLHLPQSALPDADGTSRSDEPGERSRRS